MTISERINKKFNSHGTTIEESIKNAQVGGGYSVEKTETVIYEGTGLKDQWETGGTPDNPSSSVLASGTSIDTAEETVTVSLDGEETILYKSEAFGSIAWVYPKGSTPLNADIRIFNDEDGAGVYVYCKGNVSYDSVKISTVEETVTVEDDFKKAIEVAGRVMIVHSTANSDNKYVLDKTWQEIFDFEGIVIIPSVVISSGNVGKSTNVVTNVAYRDGTYSVYVNHSTSASTTYSCSSPNDYPTSNSIG